MTQTAQDALKTAILYSDGERYALIKLPAAAITVAAAIIAEIGEPFSALLIDKDEVSLVLSADDLEDYAKRLPGHETTGRYYRLITFDGELSPDLIGFMALIAKTLADAGIWILPLGAYTRDHLLVPEEKFDAAIAALEQLKQKLTR